MLHLVNRIRHKSGSGDDDDDDDECHSWRANDHGLVAMTVG